MLGGLIIQFVLSNPVAMYVIFYPADASFGTLFTRYLLYFYPPFNFAKLMCSVS